jgi:hypothetical protein
MMVFSSLILLFILKHRTATVTERIREGYGRLGLVGLGMMLALPVVVMVFLISVIGILPGIVLLMGYILLLLIAVLFIPLILGSLIGSIVSLKNEHALFTVFIGVGAAIVLSYIPVIGPLILVIFFLTIVGALCVELYRFFKVV